MTNYKQGQVKSGTVVIGGVTQTFDMTQPVIMDGRTITQVSFGVNIGTQFPVLTFFADTDFDGNHNPHIVTRIAPDTKMPELKYFPPLVTDGGEEPTP